jgi:hypothetical protein
MPELILFTAIPGPFSAQVPLVDLERQAIHCLLVVDVRIIVGRRATYILCPSLA